MLLSHERSPNTEGLLYPLLLIAAIAVIAFSIVSIASVTGWMPRGLQSSGLSADAFNAAAAQEPAVLAEPGAPNLLRGRRR